jgi:hypothetical protein
LLHPPELNTRGAAVKADFAEVIDREGALPRPRRRAQRQTTETDDWDANLTIAGSAGFRAGEFINDPEPTNKIEDSAVPGAWPSRILLSRRKKMLIMGLDAQSILSDF